MAPLDPIIVTLASGVILWAIKMNYDRSIENRELLRELCENHGIDPDDVLE